MRLRMCVGAADVMLCGASCLPEPFFILSGFSAFQALPTAAEESAPFKKNSAGLTPGEGGAVMVLKRYTDAVRDGDHIYGTLLGVAVNNSGTGLPLKPHMPSELGCLRETYERFAIDPKCVQYIEVSVCMCVGGKCLFCFVCFICLKL